VTSAHFRSCMRTYLGAGSSQDLGLRVEAQGLDLRFKVWGLGTRV